MCAHMLVYPCRALYHMHSAWAVQCCASREQLPGHPQSPDIVLLFIWYYRKPVDAGALVAASSL